ncbi:MAG: hypothetical protein KDC39_09835 [Actinobacteria bacterium]|nr:hypothetical protein [Actinomycetota bacterium]
MNVRIKRRLTMVITVVAIGLVGASCSTTEPASVADWRDGSIVCLHGNHGAVLLDASFEVRAQAPDV